MSKLTVGLFIFMAGWGLSWLTYHYLAKDTVPAAQPVISIPTEPARPEQSEAEISVVSSVDAESLESLLQQGEFEAAVARYESLQLQPRSTAAADARAKILFHARRLVAESRFSAAETLLQRFLVAAFRDVEARLLLAEVYVAEQDLNTAIDQFYEVRAYAYRPAMLQKITGRIRSTVARQVSILNSHNDHSALLALYQHLTQLEPEHAPWFMGLAAAQLALDDRQAARSSLLLVAQNPDVGAQAQSMLSQLTLAKANQPDTATPVPETKVIGIPLTRKGHHFMVDANPAGHRHISLLIDTGATLTMLSPDVFQQPGIRYQNTGRVETFNTANGPVRAPIYVLDSLTIGDWQINQLEVGVLALPEDPVIDGLLGMNFLKHFQFFIDQNEDLLRLSSQ